jgi:hypothetical protein
MERSEEFGQTSSQMSEIAREARGLAEKWVHIHLSASTVLYHCKTWDFHDIEDSSCGLLDCDTT